MQTNLGAWSDEIQVETVVKVVCIGKDTTNGYICDIAKDLNGIGLVNDRHWE
jgi:hypothetical protein